MLIRVPAPTVTSQNTQCRLPQMSDLTTRLSTFSSSCICLLTDDVGDDRSVLVAPASEVTEELINFIISRTGGLTFVAITSSRAAAFMLSPMSRTRGQLATSGEGGILAQYTSVEAREGVTTGISAADRATTIRLLGASSPQPRALVKPGHIFPVATRSGGTLVKASIPEASVDIVQRAGYSDAALFVDLLSREGEFLSKSEAAAWASEHRIPAFSISEIIRDRLVSEPLVERIAEARVPTTHAGDVRAIVYRSRIHDIEHIACVKGSLDTSTPILTRVQVEHTIADVFGGSEPAARKQINNSLAALAESGAGVLLYLRRAALHDCPLFQDTLASTQEGGQRTTSGMREYGVGAQILRDLGISRIELLSSTHRTLVGLESFGIAVTNQRPIPTYVKNA